MIPRRVFTHYAILALALTCLLTAIPASAAPILYGSTSGFGTSTLYNISPTTGAATAIGPTGFKLIGSLSVAPDGTLYGVGVDAGETEVLLRINTATGAATVVGPLGPVGHFTVTDIAFRPSDGTLFALIALSPFVDLNLYTINLTTGAATLVGSLGVGLPSGNGLAFLGNTLYYASSTVSGGSLFTLDQGTGAATLVTAMTYPPAFGPNTSRPSGMKFDPATATLFAVIVNGVPFSESGGGNLWSLGVIDRTTGVVTFIGRTQNQMDGLAVAGVDLTPSVPTLSEWAQILMVGFLVATAIWTIRRRRLTPG